MLLNIKYILRRKLFKKGIKYDKLIHILKKMSITFDIRMS